MAPISWADNSPNIVPLAIGGTFKSANTVFTNITICEPNTSNCQKITNVELDTGSTGLRLFGTLVSLNLKVEQYSGSDVAECVQFGGGDVLWGPVKLVDVILAGEKAANIPVQIAAPDEGPPPSSCGSNPITDPSSFGANGILGISPASTDCDGEKCPGTTPGKNYFTCSSAGKCIDLSPDVALQVPNPVLHLSADSNGIKDTNGIIVSFPPVTADTGAASVSGVMILGIGTRTNNQPVSGARAFATDPDGILKATFRGSNYWTKFDTGTSFWSLPVTGTLAICTGNNSTFLCPPSPVNLSFSVIGADGQVSAPVGFEVGNADSLLNSSNLAFNNVAWNNILPESFMISMPFFFGRSVYIGISGQVTPIGKGPFYGY
jgi:hypothetical protein